MSEGDVGIPAARVQRIGQIETGAGTSSAPRFLVNLIELARQNPWFTGIVALPSLLAILYFGVIASDIYVSEARYVVRSVNNPKPSILGNMLQMSGLSAVQDDAYAVRDFIQSRDIVRRLEAGSDLRGVLSRPEGDFITRFPPPFGGHSFEQLYQTYGNFVTVKVDETTGISVLRVRAYRPDDARNIARAILGYSEDLVNRMNKRAQHDAIAVAEQEARDAEKRVEDAQAALADFRLRNRIVDPERQSAAVIDLASRLSAEQAAAQAQLTELLRSSPNSPLIPSLKQRIMALNSQIASEQHRVVNGTNGSVLSFSEYDRLMLAREFAGKNLTSALAALETARLEAQRQQIYLERIAEPNLPDYPLLPERLISILEVVLTTLLIYGIGWLVTASVREHVGR